MTHALLVAENPDRLSLLTGIAADCGGALTVEALPELPAVPARMAEGGVDIVLLDVGDVGIGSFDEFRGKFIEAGMTQFGSGWCWLAVKGGKLEIMKTPNGENPLVHGATPILGCDVWEHSYYIDYRNRRPDYLAAFVDHLINWEYVEEMHAQATA